MLRQVILVGSKMIFTHTCNWWMPVRC